MITTYSIIIVMNYNYNTLLLYAIEHNEIRIVEQILIINKTIGSRMRQFYFRQACIKGHLDIVKLLIKTIPSINVTYKNNIVFRLSCFHGHMNIVKWFMENTDVDIHSNQNHAIQWACEHNHSEIVKLLMSHISFEKTTFKSSHNQYRKQLLFNKCMYILIIHDRIELLIWFYENYDLEYQLNNYFALACENGKLSICKYFITNIKCEKIYQSCFSATCCHGHFDVVQWLISIDHIQPDAMAYPYFKNILRSGQLEICQFLLSINFKNFEYYIKTYVFDICKQLSTQRFKDGKLCEQNNLSTMKWLLKLHNIDITQNDNCLFTNCYHSGQLEMCQLLYKINPIVIHTLIPAISRHKHVDKWLTSTRKTIELSTVENN